MMGFNRSLDLHTFTLRERKKSLKKEKRHKCVYMPCYQHYHHQYYRNMSLEYDVGDNGDKDDTVVDDDEEEDKICNAF